MFPHERSLVQEFRNKNFVILGVNSDPYKTLKKILADKTVVWPCCFDGGDLYGPIAKQWNVQSWPTIYIIDQKGKIRWKGPGDNFKEKMLDDKVKELLAETGSAGKPASAQSSAVR